MLKYLFAKNEAIPVGSAAIFFGFSAILWFAIGTGLGSFNAAKLAFPDFVTGTEMFAFGHMRQVHVLAVIFGWISMAFAMAMMYITPILGNTRLWSEKLGLWNCMMWNISLLLGLSLLWMGVTSGREYSDFPWPLDLAVAAFITIPLAVNVWMTIIKRRT
ncbi:MAG: cbb3-type cytochrome c oxidase subunit I, partial [Betaproteobacteria bacterium]|nr:cbb3-type cytochrome c oxidase subunit I [Betaproteobacteria bacterium]